MPQHNSYERARGAVALVDRSDRAWIVVSGHDRRSYLQGMLTNDIVALQTGAGCYAAYLTAQGRMIADLWVYELGDTILISTAREVKPTVLARLDQFVFTEDVQLGDVSETFAAVAAVGPQSAQAVSSAISGISADRLSALPEHGNFRAEFRGQPAIVLRVTDTGQAGFDVLVAAPQLEELKAALHAAGAVDVDAATADALRIEAGIPKFHRDMDEETIPLEAGIEGRAISLTKGCYVGQEVIIRVLHRGHGRVARRLVGLTLDRSAVPPAGATVTADARNVGAITSSAFSPVLQKAVALAYVHRDFVAPGTMLTVAGVTAVVTSLPIIEGLKSEV